MNIQYSANEPLANGEHSLSGPARRIILGSGRSGTTWVQDCLAMANSLRPIFEPLHEAESNIGSRYAYGLLTPEHSCAELEDFFRHLCEGKLHSRWIDYRGSAEVLFPSFSTGFGLNSLKSLASKWRKYLRNRPVLKALIKNDQTLIKCIRANLMAEWLATKAGFFTVLVVRHPGSVIESKLRNGRVWDPLPISSRYRENKKLHEVTHGKYLAMLHSKLTTVQSLTLNWVIENEKPLADSEFGNVKVVFYEELVSNLASWSFLCRALHIQNLPDARLLRVPSLSAADQSDTASRKLEPRWKKGLTDCQLAEIQGILDACAFDLYNIRESFPKRAHGHNVLASEQVDMQ